MSEKAPSLLTAKQLRAMPEYKRRQLAEFAEVMNNDLGCVTPTEEFLTSLIARYACSHFPITPESLIEDIEKFREDFESTVQDTRRFAHRYPAEVFGDNCGQEKQQTDALKALAIDEYESVDLLQKARKLIRLCPSLILRTEEALPKEWTDLFAKYQTVPRRKIET